MPRAPMLITDVINIGRHVFFGFLISGLELNYAIGKTKGQLSPPSCTTQKPVNLACRPDTGREDHNGSQHRIKGRLKVPHMKDGSSRKIRRRPSPRRRDHRPQEHEPEPAHHDQPPSSFKTFFTP